MNHRVYFCYFLSHGILASIGNFGVFDKKGNSDFLIKKDKFLFIVPQIHKRFSSFWREVQHKDEAAEIPELKLLRELKARLEAPVPLEQDRSRYEIARKLLGQRLARKLHHNVDTNEYLNSLRWENKNSYR